MEESVVHLRGHGPVPSSLWQAVRFKFCSNAHKNSPKYSINRNIIPKFSTPPLLASSASGLAAPPYEILDTPLG